MTFDECSSNDNLKSLLPDFNGMHDKQKRNFQDHSEKYGLPVLKSGTSMGKYLVS